MERFLSETTDHHSSSIDDLNATHADDEVAHGVHEEHDVSQFDLSGGGQFLVVTLLVGILLRGMGRATHNIPQNSRFRFLSALSAVPYTVWLLVTGFLIGVIHSRAELASFGDSISMWSNMHPHLILFVFLPPLIFRSSSSVNYHVFSRSMPQMVTLALPGVVLCSAMTAALAIYGFDYEFSWTAGMAFGAMLSATDPVAVVALLHDLGAPEQLSHLIEGESLLNDGTALVVFVGFLDVLIGEADLTAGFLIETFCRLSLGGLALGLLAGYLTIWALKMTRWDSVAQLAIMVAATYATFLLAEMTALHVSGVLATVTLGLYVAANRATAITDHEAFNVFWEMLEYIANTVIFTLAGVVIFERGIHNSLIEAQDWGYLVILYIGLNIIRGLAMLILWWPMNRKWMGYPLTWKDLVVSTYGGLRGAVGLVLGLLIENEAGRGQVTDKMSARFLFHIAGIAFLTLMVNATTIKNLVQALGLGTPSPAAVRSFRKAVHRVQGAAIQLKSKLKTDEFLGDADWAAVRRVMGPVFAELAAEHEHMETRIKAETVDDQANFGKTAFFLLGAIFCCGQRAALRACMRRCCCCCAGRCGPAPPTTGPATPASGADTPSQHVGIELGTPSIADDQQQHVHGSVSGGLAGAPRHTSGERKDAAAASGEADGEDGIQRQSTFTLRASDAVLMDIRYRLLSIVRRRLWHLHEQGVVGDTAFTILLEAIDRAEDNLKSPLQEWDFIEHQLEDSPIMGAIRLGLSWVERCSGGAPFAFEKMALELEAASAFVQSHTMVRPDLQQVIERGMALDEVIEEANRMMIKARERLADALSVEEVARAVKTRSVLRQLLVTQEREAEALLKGGEIKESEHHEILERIHYAQGRLKHELATRLRVEDEQVLSEVPFMQRLSSEDFSAMVAAAKFKILERGDVLVKQGTRTHGFYLVLSGVVNTHHKSKGSIARSTVHASAPGTPRSQARAKHSKTVDAALWGRGRRGHQRKKTAEQDMNDCEGCGDIGPVTVFQTAARSSTRALGADGKRGEVEEGGPQAGDPIAEESDSDDSDSDSPINASPRKVSATKARSFIAAARAASEYGPFTGLERVEDSANCEDEYGPRVEQLKPGHVVGVLSMLTGMKTLITAVCSSRVRVVHFAQKDIYQLLRSVEPPPGVEFRLVRPLEAVVCRMAGVLAAETSLRRFANIRADSVRLLMNTATLLRPQALHPIKIQGDFILLTGKMLEPIDAKRGMTLATNMPFYRSHRAYAAQQISLSTSDTTVVRRRRRNSVDSQNSADDEAAVCNSAAQRQDFADVVTRVMQNGGSTPVARRPENAMAAMAVMTPRARPDGEQAPGFGSQSPRPGSAGLRRANSGRRTPTGRGTPVAVDTPKDEEVAVDVLAPRELRRGGGMSQLETQVRSAAKAAAAARARGVSPANLPAGSSPMDHIVEGVGQVATPTGSPPELGPGHAARSRTVGFNRDYHADAGHLGEKAKVEVEVDGRRLVMDEDDFQPVANAFAFVDDDSKVFRWFSHGTRLLLLPRGTMRAFEQQFQQELERSVQRTVGDMHKRTLALAAMRWMEKSKASSRSRQSSAPVGSKQADSAAGSAAGLRRRGTSALLREALVHEGHGLPRHPLHHAATANPAAMAASMHHHGHRSRVRAGVANRGPANVGNADDDSDDEGGRIEAHHSDSAAYLHTLTEHRGRRQQPRESPLRRSSVPPRYSGNQGGSGQAGGEAGGRTGSLAGAQSITSGLAIQEVDDESLSDEGPTPEAPRGESVQAKLLRRATAGVDAEWRRRASFRVGGFVDSPGAATSSGTPLARVQSNPAPAPAARGEVPLSRAQSANAGGIGLSIRNPRHSRPPTHVPHGHARTATEMFMDGTPKMQAVHRQSGMAVSHSQSSLDQHLTAQLGEEEEEEEEAGRPLPRRPVAAADVGFSMDGQPRTGSLQPSSGSLLPPPPLPAAEVHAAPATEAQQQEEEEAEAAGEEGGPQPGDDDEQ